MSGHSELSLRPDCLPAYLFSTATARVLSVLVASTMFRPCLDAVNGKRKIFVNRLHDVLNVVEK